MSEPAAHVIGGRYRVVRKLGQGGMGSVFLAVDETNGRTVAVKTIISDLARDPTLMGRFEREAKAAAALDTPHIVAVLDAGRDETAGLSYMVMEYLDGEDFQQLLKRLGPVPADLALRVAAQACLALQKAHEQRIVHRDIKPANFYLARTAGDQRIVKLLDFGVAKVRREASQDSAMTAGLTRTGSVLGSPLYMSPEQARGYKDIDHRSDLWSLGVSLYQALAGRTPHGDTDELGELIILICTEAPPPVQDVAPWVAPEVAAIVHRALRRNPAERYGSGAEMYAAITQLLQSDISIPEAMVRSISPAERAYVAPRLTEGVNEAPPPRRGSISSATQAPVPSPTHPDAAAGYPGAASYPGAPAPATYPGAAYPQGAYPGAPAPATYPGAAYPQGPQGAYPGAPLAMHPMAAPGAHPGVPATYPGAASHPGAVSYPAAPAVAASGVPGLASTQSAMGGTVHPGIQGAPPSAAVPPKSKAPLFIGVGAVVLLAGGAAAFQMTRKPAEAPPIAVTAAAPTSAPAVPDKLHTVSLVILPDDASVEVDGAAARAKNGVIEIQGQLGSVHKVRLFRPGAAGAPPGDDITENVVVTENGALPPKLVLQEAAKPASAASAASVVPKPGPMPTGVKPRAGAPVIRTDR